MATGAYPYQWKTVQIILVFRDRGGGPHRSPPGAPQNSIIRENEGFWSKYIKFPHHIFVNRGLFLIRGWGYTPPQ